MYGTSTEVEGGCVPGVLVRSLLWQYPVTTAGLGIYSPSRSRSLFKMETDCDDELHSWPTDKPYTIQSSKTMWIISLYTNQRITTFTSILLTTHRYPPSQCSPKVSYTAVTKSWCSHVMNPHILSMLIELIYNFYAKDIRIPRHSWYVSIHPLIPNTRTTYSQVCGIKAIIANTSPPHSPSNTLHLRINNRHSRIPTTMIAAGIYVPYQPSQASREVPEGELVREPVGRWWWRWERKGGNMR